MNCPITCPCRRGAAGAFVLACCAWAAIWSPIFLGGKFGALFAGLLFEPHVLAPALVAWAIAAAIGLWLAISGIRPALEEGDDALSWAVSLAAIGGGSAALGLGWHLPAAWGSLLSLGSEGFYVAVIAAGAANALLSLAARGYDVGYSDGISVQLRAADLPGFDHGQSYEVIERQSRMIAALTAERDRLADELANIGPPAHDLEEVLCFPGVRRAVLKVLHRDSHPGASESEARIYDQRFQRANAVFERIGTE